MINKILLDANVIVRLFMRDHEAHYKISEAFFLALEAYTKKNIDFADAMLCAKKNLEGYEVMSFDKDIKKCTKEK